MSYSQPVAAQVGASQVSNTHVAVCGPSGSGLTSTADGCTGSTEVPVAQNEPDHSRPPVDPIGGLRRMEAAGLLCPPRGPRDADAYATRSPSRIAEHMSDEEFVRWIRGSG